MQACRVTLRFTTFYLFKFEDFNHSFLITDVIAESQILTCPFQFSCSKDKILGTNMGAVDLDDIEIKQSLEVSYLLCL